MPDIKNFSKKFESEKIKKIEEIEGPENEVEKESGLAERVQEKQVERAGKEKAFELEEQAGGQEAAGLAASQSILQKRKEREKQIENILAKDMEEMYINMDPAKQQEFKREGEKTAREISSLLEKAKVKVKKIIGLIKKWLSIIPGINKFFLEQESKIKADEILKIKQQHGK
jgi:hypothetical protein